MNIVAFKCNDTILNAYGEKVDNIYLILEEWDELNVKYHSHTLSKVTQVFKIKTIDSIEQLSSIYADLKSRNIKIDKAISGAEYGSFAAGFFNSLLCNDTHYLDLSLNSRDKRSMKDLFEYASLNYAKYYPSYSEEDFKNGLKHNLQYPIIVKPATGTGSFNTQMISNEKELENYFNNLSLHPAIFSNLLTLEEFIDGDEFHIDIIWKDGQVKFINISKYLVPRLAVMQNPTKNGSVTLNPDKHKQLYSSVLNECMKINEKLGLKNGVTHTEYFEKNGKRFYSEIATRFGGGGTSDSIETAWGVNIIEEWINVELDNNINIDYNYLYDGAWLNFIPLKNGKVIELPNIKDIENIDWINTVQPFIKTNDYFSFDNPSTWGIIISLKGESFDDINDKVDYLYQNFHYVLNE